MLYENKRYSKPSVYKSYSIIEGVIIEDRDTSCLVVIKAQDNTEMRIIVPKNLISLDNFGKIIGSKVNLYKSESGKILNAELKMNEPDDIKLPDIITHPGVLKNEEYPQTIGTARLDILEMKNDFKFNPKIISFLDELSIKFSA